MNDILQINAHLKYVEFLLFIFDNENDQITLGEIRTRFKATFGTDTVLLNQNYGIYRLLPLILMKEEYKNRKKELSGDIKKIKIIRDAIAHHKFIINEHGYEFTDGKNKVSFSYEEFNVFIHSIENNFYAEIA